MTDAILAEIALQHLGIDRLDAQGRDYLDFHEVSVATLRQALHAAFEAGRRSAPLPAADITPPAPPRRRLR